MKEYKCDICGKDCGKVEPVYFQNIPFLIENKQISQGSLVYETEVYSDFDIEIWAKNKNGRAHICGDCTKIINRKIAEELRRKIGL